MTLCGAVLVFYWLGSAVMEIIGLYTQALADPMADPAATMNAPNAAGGDASTAASGGAASGSGQSSEQQISGNVFRYAIWGLGGAVLFTVGVKGLTMSAFRRRRRNDSARAGESVLEAELAAARARRDAGRDP